MPTTPASPVDLIVRFTARPGCEAALRDALLKMQKDTHAEPGEKVYDLYEASEGRQFFYYESWPSQAALDFHNQTPHLKALGAIIEPLMEGKADLRFVKKLGA